MNEFLLEPKKEKIPYYFHGPQIIVAWIFYQQGISIQNSWLIAELFSNDQSRIDEIIKDNNIKVSDLLVDYHFLMGYVIYYDGGGEYRPTKKNKQERAFFNFFRGYNSIEKRVELVGDKMILIYCVYSEC